MFADYDEHDALGLAELVKQGQVSAAELLETAIARLEKVNPTLNAVVHTTYAPARAAAERPVAGPFQGVPFLIKDLIQDIAGQPTVGGSRFWRGWVADRDSELVRRYRAAGLIFFGKTNTPENGLMPVTEPEVFGPTRTPWDTGRTSGGSSGGAGAAVASGVVPMAHGGDGGGSIRIPAACCGVFGLKPTRGRTPTGPGASEQWNGFAIEHVLSRSVRDSAAALDAVRGAEDIAPYHAPHFAGRYLDEVAKAPGKLRIGFHAEPAMPSDVHPDCVAAVHEVAQLCEELGHHVEEVRPAFEPMELAMAFYTVVASQTAAEIHEGEAIRGRKARPADYETATWLSGQMGRVFTGADYAIALRRLQAEARRLVHRLGDYDLVLTPTLGQPPVKLGALKPSGPEAVVQDLVKKANLRAPLRLPGLLEKTVAEVFDFIPFTPVANFTGQPAMSVPLVWKGGLPIGTMFTARFGDDATLFRLARQLEEARPWKDRRPPVHAAS